MRNTLTKIFSVLVLVLGGGWWALSVIGNMALLADFPKVIADLASFVVKHQDVGYQIAPWVLMAMGVFALLLLRWPHLFGQTGGAAASNGKPELSILIGQDGHYVSAQSHNVYNIMKTVMVGVKNTGGVFLSNCKLSYEAQDKDGGELQKWLSDGPFSLNVGEERYVSLAAYNEPVSPHPVGADGIRLAGPPSGNFWRPPTLSSQGGVVTITAESAESQPCKTICRLWVSDEKLHWEKV